MRIGIDVSPAIRRYKTGTEWYTYNLIEALKKVDLTNHFFLLYSPIPLSAELAQLPARWQNKVLPWPFKYLWTQIRLSLEMLFNQPDVLFVPAHAIPLIHPKKVITTIHDLGFERFPEAYTRWQRFYYRFAHRFAAEHATKIIVPSEFTKRELINLYNVSSEKIVVVPLGYDSNIFKVYAQEKIQEVLTALKISEPYLLYFGRLTKKKGLIKLIDAFKSVGGENQDLKLVLLGKPDFGYQEIKQRIAFHKLENKVIELGWVEKDKMPFIVGGARLCLMPSLYEGFGLPVLEAMACGAPIIISANEALVEVGGEAALMVKNDSVEAWIEAIKQVLSSRELREEMISDGFIQSRNFSWEKCAKNTLAVIDELTK